MNVTVCHLVFEFVFVGWVWCDGHTWSHSCPLLPQTHDCTRAADSHQQNWEAFTCIHLSLYSVVWIQRVWRVHVSLSLSLSSDATKITLAPSNADVSVGERARMECAASHDPTLDLTFIWSLDANVIDFDRDREHYERKMVNSVFSSSIIIFASLILL